MLPNFLFIGPDKSGSTWLYEVLKSNPEVYVPVIKDIYYFDRYYYKGRKWYESFFSSVHNEKAIGELSHDYLYSADAARRIHECIPDVKLVVCLRNPVDRAISCYRYCLRLGLVNGEFEEAANRYPSIINNGFYYRAICNYLEYFDLSQLLILWYKEILVEPRDFIRRLYKNLGVDDKYESPVLSKHFMAAGKPRNVIVARYAKHSAEFLRDMGFVKFVGYMKSKSVIQDILYKNYKRGDNQTIDTTITEKLRETYYSDIVQLESLLGNDLSEWYKR